jgi:uncharacterized surface protein with fasciclin (FAS1) repeats
MKALTLLPLAVAATAFVIPDEQTMNTLSLDYQETPARSLFDEIPSTEEAWQELEEAATKAAGCAKHMFDEAVDHTFTAAVKFSEKFEDALAGETWLQSANYDLDLFTTQEESEDHPPHHGPPPHPGPPHHGPPPHPGPPHHGPPPHPGPPHHGPPRHRRPHHPPHHHTPNLTIYELISKYTTKLAKLIDEFPEFVKALNATAHNYTVFAPTNRAFKKIPKHAPKPSKEQLKTFLEYHASKEFFPAGRVLASTTIPTALKGEAIGGFPQRLSTQVGLRGLTINFYARVVAIDIFGTNGVIHGIDSILLPPPKIVDILSALPGEFSTLELALVKTGLFAEFNDTSSHVGGTLFAPSNSAFRRLGPRINAFLFSKYGEKYLKALVLYHAAPNFTLYSDAYYPPEGQTSIPRRRFHVDLETGLKGKSLSVDVARFGRLVDIRVNGFNHVSVKDGIAKDGVIQVIPSILIPPKTPGAFEESSDELTVEELKERLEPYLEEDNNMEL